MFETTNRVTKIMAEKGVGDEIAASSTRSPRRTD